MVDDCDCHIEAIERAAGIDVLRKLADKRREELRLNAGAGGVFLERLRWVIDMLDREADQLEKS